MSEFNLSEKRKEVENLLEHTKLIMGERLLIMNYIEKQDKEFTGQIADKSFFNEGKIIVDIEDIKKLAGEKLI